MYEKIQIDCRDRYVSKYTVPKTKFTDPNEHLLELIVTFYCIVKLNGLPIWMEWTAEFHGSFKNWKYTVIFLVHNSLSGSYLFGAVWEWTD